MRRRFRTLLRLALGTALLLPAVFAAFAAQLPASARSLVQARVEPVTIPTYMIGPPDPNPIFFAGRAYQGAKGPVYPYALLDRITGVKSDRAYRALVGKIMGHYRSCEILATLGGAAHARGTRVTTPSENGSVRTPAP